MAIKLNGQGKDIKPPTPAQKAQNAMQQIFNGISLSPHEPPADLMPLLIAEATPMADENATHLDIHILARVLWRVNYGNAFEQLTSQRYADLKRKYEKEEAEFIANSLKK